jgi:hypothetical protein
MYIVLHLSSGVPHMMAWDLGAAAAVPEQQALIGFELRQG